MCFRRSWVLLFLVLGLDAVHSRFVLLRSARTPFGRERCLLDVLLVVEPPFIVTCPLRLSPVRLSTMSPKVTVGILDRLNLLGDYKMAEREEDTAQVWCGTNEQRLESKGGLRV